MTPLFLCFLHFYHSVSSTLYLVSLATPFRGLCEQNLGVISIGCRINYVAIFKNQHLFEMLKKTALNLPKKLAIHC